LQEANREYPTPLLGRSGTLRSFAGQLLHQVRIEPLSRRCVRDLERILFNATDYFLHANDTPGNIARKPRSTVNEFGVSVGGPILKDKVFFFGHYEGIRIALPLVARTTVPSAAYQQYVLQQLPQGGSDPINGTVLPAQPEEVAFYQKMFGLYSNTAGTPTPVLTCPLDASGVLLTGTQTSINLFNGSGCANKRTQSLNNIDSENLIVVKMDHTLNANNSVWYRFQQDTGLQAAYTDAINPCSTPTPRNHNGHWCLGYTHLFTPHAGEPVQSRCKLVLESFPAK